MQVYSSSNGPVQRKRLPAVQTAVLASAASAIEPSEAPVFIHGGNARHLLMVDGQLSQECSQLSMAVRFLRRDQAEQLPPCKSDFLCGVCEQLLWQPAVPTCGHAVCGACLPGRMDAFSCCTVCQLPLSALPSTCKLVRSNIVPALVKVET